MRIPDEKIAMSSGRAVWAALIAGVCMAGVAAAQGEFTKDGKSFKYVWGPFLDAEATIADKSQDVQIIALRKGLLQQKAGDKFLDLRKVVGLWQASVDRNGKLGKTEMVMDVTSHVLEKYNVDMVPPATLNAKMMSACGDPSGQTHVFMTITVLNAEGKAQNRFFYLRKNKTTWEEMITPDQGDYHPGLTSFATKDAVYFYYLQNLKDPNPALISHSLPIRYKIEKPQWLLFGAPGPYPIHATDFTAFARGNNPVVVFREKGDTAVSLARWENGRNAWNIQKDAFSPRINNALVGDAITGMSGFAAADGTLYVFAAFHFNNIRQIVRLRCSGKDSSWSSDVVLNQSADWVSAVQDTIGQTHLIGVNDKGGVWYATADARNSWSFKGIMLDESRK
jgi:hypothetical protein